MPPQPADKWEGVRSSRMFGPTCPQAVRMGWGADEHAFAFHWDDGYPGEDCLRVNIWTPGLNDGKKRPVMVWLHGGGYAAGSGQELPSYDGFNLAKKGDAVVVTLNHRLNVLGFLDLSAYGDKYAKSGNAGLLDLVAALQWVNKNIAAFGGDAQNVTIFGQSGGGGKVSTLLATPSAKGSTTRPSFRAAPCFARWMPSIHVASALRDGRVGIESLADRRAAEDALRTAACCR